MSSKEKLFSGTGERTKFQQLLSGEWGHSRRTGSAKHGSEIVQSLRFGSSGFEDFSLCSAELMNHDPLILDPKEGVTVPLGASRLTIKLDAAATGGRFAMLEYDVAPNFVAPNVPHWHTRESHTIYVLHGRIDFQFATRLVEAEPGMVLHIPEHCAFTWRNPEPNPARMLYLFAPAGFEQFFRDVQQVYADHPGMTPSDAAPHVAALWSEYGIEQ